MILYKRKDLTNLAQRYSIKHEIAYYECDINQQMTLPSLIQVMIKASEEQSDHLNWIIWRYEKRIWRNL